MMKRSKPTAGTNDFAAYVLQVGKRGYSVHYAACAAVMLRYFGVPSRYVEGYYINAETAAARSVSGRVDSDRSGAAGMG